MAITGLRLTLSDPSFTCDLGGTVTFGDGLTGAGLSGSFMIDAGQLNLYNGIQAGGDAGGCV